MFRLICMLLFVLMLPPAAFADDPPLDARWLKSTEIYTRKGESWLMADLFGNTYTGQVIPAGCATMGQWCTVDTKLAGVGADAKSVFLQGLLIITAGADSPPATADLTLFFRRPGDTAVTCTGHYSGQAVISTFTGERTNFAGWYPVTDGKLEFCWRRTTTANWPASAAYGWNLGVQAWVK